MQEPHKTWERRRKQQQGATGPTLCQGHKGTQQDSPSTAGTAEKGLGAQEGRAGEGHSKTLIPSMGVQEGPRQGTLLRAQGVLTPQYSL